MVRILCLVIALLQFSACGGGNGGGDLNLQSLPANTAPSANAGVDQTVKESTKVTLTGSSIDAEEDTISFAWVQIAGPVLSLTGDNTSTLEFTAPDVEEGSPQILTFQLTTSDPGGLSTSDEVQVTVEDPIAQLTTYCHGGFNKLFITNDDGIETYEIAVQALGAVRTEMTGSRSENNLLLEGTIEEFSFNYDITIAEDESTISLVIDGVRGNKTFILNEYGVRGDCSQHVGGLDTLPRVVRSDFTNVAGFIEDISYFRSSAGHDYSDSFESCRSMKHYFSPREEERKNTNVPVYSPFAGTIVQLNTEEGGGFVDDGITNQRTMILSEDNSAVLAVIFHIDLQSAGLTVGSSVEAGQQLGHARMESHRGVVHDFDIAMHLNTADGVRYISYFELLDEDVFSGYIGFGSYRSDFIITESQRNADPLTCDGETFTSNGSLARWIFDI